MSRMLSRNFKLVGRCHPWCGNRELTKGRAAEKQEWERAVLREHPDALTDKQGRLLPPPPQQPDAKQYHRDSPH